jgi:hypothetical protein
MRVQNVQYRVCIVLRRQMIVPIEETDGDRWVY